MTYVCPLCEGAVKKIECSIDNLYRCHTEGCWFRSNYIPVGVVEKLCKPAKKDTAAYIPWGLRKMVEEANRK